MDTEQLTASQIAISSYRQSLLCKIALSPNPVSTADSIDLAISYAKADAAEEALLDLICRIDQVGLDPCSSTSTT